MLSLPTNARSGVAVVACIVLFGMLSLSLVESAHAEADITDSGTYPSLGRFSAKFMVTPPELTSNFSTLEIADVGGVSDGNSSDYLVHIQLAQTVDDVNDPFEGFNRAMFGFNEFLYDAVLGPGADVYNVLPHEARTIVGNFLSNLSEPVVFLNDLLQGEVERALTTFTRFAMNSTIGFAGLADVASAAGVEGHGEDFGQTLAVWGVGEGFYLVLPLLGPSNPRDATGQYLVDTLIDPMSIYLDNYGVDTLIDPMSIYLDNYGGDDWLVPRTAVTGFHDLASVRDELVMLKKNSFDYYAAIRSLYRQKREIEISNDSETYLPAIPDFEFSDFPTPDGLEPALGSYTKDADIDGDNDGEISALTQASAIDDYNISLDPFEPRFEPEIRHAATSPVEADAMLVEDAWQARVVMATEPR